MQQVYLLLRNNQQSGPYDLEELLQLQLKPFDLVWVHGRSAAWQYPGEIPALKPFVPQTPRPDIPYLPITTAAMEQQQTPINKTTPHSVQLASKNVFVSMPKTMPSVPQRNYESPVRAAAPVDAETAAGDTVTGHQTLRNEEPQARKPEEKYTESAYTRPLNDVDGSYSPWNFGHTKKAKSSIGKRDLIIAVLLAGFIAGAYYLLSKPSIVQNVQQAKNQPGQAIIKQTKEPAQIETKLPEPVKDISFTTFEKSINYPIDEAAKPVTPVPSKKAAFKRNTVVYSNNPVATSEILKESPSEPIKEASLPPPVASSPKEKKKKLGESIREIFSTSKNKKEEPKNNTVVLEEPRPATDRKAARREESESSSSNTTTEEAGGPALSDLVDISSNAPDNWMMGVTGLKITLRNRSQVVIQTAAVDVLYFDANNRLLEKKMVYFSNIAAKGKLTLPAPDHKWADHVNLKLSAVSAKEDRYARD